MIVGAVDIDTEWDIYIQTLKSMGIEGAVNLYQNAYSRHMHMVVKRMVSDTNIFVKTPSFFAKILK